MKRKRTYQLRVRANEAERLALRRLAEMEQVRVSEAMRIALREAARARGLWPAADENGEGGRHA